MFAAMSLLVSLAAQADFAPEAPAFCQSLNVTEGYLLPTRVERLIPTNTSIWARELFGAPHDYAILDATGAHPIAFDVERTGLAGSILVELRPKVMLERNHRIEVSIDSVMVANFTVNVGSDSVPPSTPTLTVVPASVASAPTCNVSGFEVQAGLLNEPGLYLVEEDGEPVAADLFSPIFVPASARSTRVRLTAVDLAGNRSGPTAEQTVVPDLVDGNAVNARRSDVATAQLACTCTGALGGASAWGLLLGLALFFRRR